MIAVWLFSTLLFGIQSCDDQSSQFEKSKVRFSLTPGTSPEGRVQNTDLPGNARLRISLESGSGATVFRDQEIEVVKAGEGYTAEVLELPPGSYVITALMIVDDVEVLNATPKRASPLSEFVEQALPYNFSVADNGVAEVNMQVIDARNEKPGAFGYASFKLNKANTLSFIVSKPKGVQTSLKEATAELRQGKNLIKSFSVRSGMNKLVFDGELDATYTLSVFAVNAAKATTFNFQALKKALRGKPLKIDLEPALLLTMESYVDEGNEYGEYFELALEGTPGTVNINWGDCHEDEWTFPFVNEHEYTFGTYTAIITGDLDQITNFYGFSYGTIMYAIDGLTNLTALKTYNPSWGAVPIKVDLSNCRNLETIYIAKYGAPYEPVDLRTDFKLPAEHYIKEFVLDIPSLGPDREFVTADEFEVMINNIYNNTVRRSIADGIFFVYPIDAWSPAAQEKMDILMNDYHWDVRLDGIFWDYSAFGRSTQQDLDARRDRWLQEKFPGNKRLLRRAKMVVSD